MRRGEDHPIRPQGAGHVRQLTQRRLGLRVDQFEEQVVSLSFALGHAPEEHLVDPVIAPSGRPVLDRAFAVVDGENEIGARSGHAPGAEIGDIAEAVDRLLNPIPDQGFNVRAAVDDPRDRLPGDPRSFRNVIYRYVGAL